MPPRAQRTGVGRRCIDAACPGRAWVLSRHNSAKHIGRRLQCDVCGLRWSTTERFTGGVIKANLKQIVAMRAREAKARNRANQKSAQLVTAGGK